MNDIVDKNQDLESLGSKRTRSIPSVHRADAKSVHYLAAAEEEEAASCVRYSRSSLAAWKRP